MLFPFPMAAKLIIAGMVHPLHALGSEPLHFPPENGPFERPLSRPQPDAIVVASTLLERLDRYKLSAQSHEFRTPACTRQRGEARANFWDIWEDTRLQAMQCLVEHGSIQVDDLASADVQSALLEALRQLDTPKPPFAPTGDALIDTITAPFCALRYLAEKCVEVGVAPDIPASAQKSFIGRCEFAGVWQQNRRGYPLLFPGYNIPTVFSILWDFVTRLAKDIAVISFFGAPLETAIQRDLRYIKTKYAKHPRFEECCQQLTSLESQIRETTEPSDFEL